MACNSLEGNTIRSENDCPPDSSSPLAATQINAFKGFGVAAIELVRGFEEGIASLKSDQARISRDLEATRDALAYEKEEREKDRVCSLSAHSALGAKLLETLQAQFTAREHADERTVTDDMPVNSLRRLRAQHVQVSRALRQESKANAFLTKELQTERAARQEAEDTVADLLLKNFDLFEHNKLLIGRDTALQTDISSMVTKSYADHWTRLALEDELRRVRSGRTSENDVVNLISHSRHSNLERHHTQDIIMDPLLRTAGGTNVSESAYLTIESNQAALRLKLVAAQDKLQVAEQKLVVALDRCHTLSGKVSSLQNYITTCVDKCGAALEVERQLRYDIEARMQNLPYEELVLKSQEPIDDSGNTDSRTSVGVWTQSTGHVQQMNLIAIAAFERCDILEKENLKQVDLVRELSAKISAQDNFQRELLELKDKVICYEKMERAMSSIRGQTMDIRLKTRTSRVSGAQLFVEYPTKKCSHRCQRLAQRKKKRKLPTVRINNHHIHCENDLSTSFINDKMFVSSSASSDSAVPLFSSSRNLERRRRSPPINLPYLSQGRRSNLLL